MENIQLDKLFESTNKCVLDFFQTPGAANLIPEYQRGYSWDKDNINQLLTDINEGVSRLAEGGASLDQEIHFLGTIIIVDGSGNKYKDPKGKPTRIDMIIDGQQRVITLSIMASLIIKELKKYLKVVKEKSPAYNEVKEIVATWNKKLMSIICFDLMRGKPNLKPKIIRGGQDYWTCDDDINKAYQSELAKYQALFIEAVIASETPGGVPEYPSFEAGSYYANNAKRIEKWLSNEVAKAHEDDEDYPNAKTILKHIDEELLWDYERPILTDLVDKQFTTEKDKESATICSLVQVLAAAHYVLQRCCFCLIKTAKEDWAFDMFQSLNATGTPLTALETFKPIVLNYLKTNKVEYRGSMTEKHFKKVEDFLSAPNSAVQKTKRTNDFLVSFFVAFNGEKVPTHFSGERRALVEGYNSITTSEEKEQFIKKMGDYADFYDRWLAFDASTIFKINEFNEEADLASLLIAFLKDSNHRMAITTLATAYQDVLDGKIGASQPFIDTVKATAAFYFLWRSVLPNNGLDVAYRDYFGKCFETKTAFSVKGLKAHLQKTLDAKGIKKDIWIRNAAMNIKYDKNTDFTKLALLIASTDTIPDTVVRGSIKKGKPGTFDYLKVKYWTSEDLKTIEHIAPQTNVGIWDSALYDPATMYVHSLGNLTLLPVDINSSVGNKEWKEKLLYYKSVAEDDPAVLAGIENTAKSIGVTLSKDTVKLLQDCKYSHHIKPISSLDYFDSWKADLVKTRTEAMLNVIWDRLTDWLAI